MKFVTTTNTLRLVMLRSFKSKNGRDCNIVTLADTDTYENIELMLSKDTDATALVAGTDYKASVSYDGRYWSVDLSTIKR